MGYLWTNFTDGVIEYAMSAYSSLDPWTYPLILLGFVGFVYGVMHSLTVTVVAIIFTLGIYAVTTSVFVDVPDVSLFLYLVSIVGITMLIVMLFTKRRG